MRKKHLHIEFKHLEEVNKEDILELMNHPLVLRQMPLAKGRFDDDAYEQFLSTKKQLWRDHGYGPWAFIVDGEFAGWGGLQYEHGDPDLAMVLHPEYWGIGKYIYEEILEQAFGEMGFKSITILLPPSRKPSKTLLRYHFKRDGEVKIENESFLRFRLHASDALKKS